MLAKLLLLLVYCLIIFVAARVLDLSATWLEAGCLASHLFDPFTLSVRKLKSILEQRGVGYCGVLEKKELAELVEVSGGVSKSEQCSVLPQNTAEETDENNEFVFSGESHFFEEVEDTKAGSWLIEIVPTPESSPYTVMRRKQWNTLRKKVSRFGIRTGTFKCDNDPRLCWKHEWYDASLVLSMPQSNQPKGNVILQRYDSKASVQGALEWINEKLSSKVHTLESVEEFNRNFMADLKENGIYVVLFSTLKDPPLYMASLSIQFTGRAKFGHVITKDWKQHKKILREFGIYTGPNLMVFTPERNFTYGTRRGERDNFKSMELFLKTMHPEVNDIFLATITLVNLSCTLEVFLTQGGVLKKGFGLICMLVFYNMSLIVLFLPIVGLFQIPSLAPVLGFGLKTCRYIMGSDYAAIVRHDYLRCMEHKCLFLGGFLLFGVCAGLIKRKYKGIFGSPDEVSEDPNDDWFSQDLDYFYHMVHSFRSLWNRHQIDFSNLELDGLDLLVRHLAVPDLWLRPLIPTDYIRNLPVWKFCCARTIRTEDEVGLLKEKDPVVNNEKAKCCAKSEWPDGMLACKECVICLEEFKLDCLLLGLPCGHSFHQLCIEMWLSRGSITSNYCCPVCRWPAFKLKNKPYTPLGSALL